MVNWFDERRYTTGVLAITMTAFKYRSDHARARPRGKISLLLSGRQKFVFVIMLYV